MEDRFSLVVGRCRVCTNEGENTKGVLRMVNNAFNERLRPLIAGTNDNYKPLDLGCPSELLLKCGFGNLPIQISVQRLVDKKLQKTHPYKLVSIVNLPESISYPVAVFQSKSRGDSKVILTELEENGYNFVVAIELDRLSGNRLVNSVRSVYPKDNIKDVLLWVCQDSLLVHGDKEKLLNWLDKQQSNSADVTQLIKEATKIVSGM